MFKFYVYKVRDLKTQNFWRLKSDIINIKQIEETYVEMIFENRESISKKTETNNSILLLKNAFDLENKVLSTLNNFKKPFGWVVFFLPFLFNFFYMHI